MSSVSFNSFIYFVLNRHYRQELANLTRCASWKHLRAVFAIFGKDEAGGEELKLSGPFEDAAAAAGMLKNGNGNGHFGGIGSSASRGRSPQAAWTPIAARKGVHREGGGGILQKEVIIQDANNNNNSQILKNGYSLTGTGNNSNSSIKHARVRYVSEKPANCKILFRSRFASNDSAKSASANSNVSRGRALNLKLKTATSASVNTSSSASSASASGDTYRELSSGVSKGSGGVRGRSAVKVTGPNGKPCRLQRSNAVRVSGGGVSTASMASSNGSRSFDEPSNTHRGSDI